MYILPESCATPSKRISLSSLRSLPDNGHVGPKAGEHNGHVGPKAGEHNGHVGPKAGEHKGHMGPRAGEGPGLVGSITKPGTYSHTPSVSDAGRAWA